MTALLTGHKSTVNALGVQRDSNPDSFHAPKFETIAETFRRLYNGAVGIVSTAFIADATPAGVVAHTRDRSQFAAIIEQYLNGVTANYSWTEWDGPQVLLGGGAENFYGPGTPDNNSQTYKNQDYYDLFAERGKSHCVVGDVNRTTAESIRLQRCNGQDCAPECPRQRASSRYLLPEQHASLA